MADQGTEQRGRSGARTGIVSSAGEHKTIRVIVNNLVKHPMYGKYIRRRTKIAAHDAGNAARVGDVVEIVPCRRISKTKSWRLVRIVRRSDAGLAEASGPAGEG